MTYVVSIGLGLLSQTSNMVKRKVELAKKAAYGMGIWDFVQDLKKELEDPTDSKETITTTLAIAGHRHKRMQDLAGQFARMICGGPGWLNRPGQG